MKPRILASAAAAVLLIGGFAAAQVPPDKDALLNGEEAAMGRQPESHGFPGPKRVLDVAVQLELSAGQKRAVQKIFDEMRSRAKELGRQIVRIEVELNNALAEGLVSERSVSDDAVQIGRLRGKLRAVHLAAHVKTRRVLKADQIELYEKLRAAEGKKGR